MDDFTTHPPSDIPVPSLLVASSLVFLVVLVSVNLKLDLERKIVVSAVRTVCQLLALGFLLYPIFAHNQWYVVMPYMAMMVFFAAREASAKPNFAYVGLMTDIVCALGGGLTISFGLCASVILKPHPWWDAQYMIPIGGMLLGNSLTALSLGIDRFLAALRDGGQVDCLLACGASRWEAVLPAIRLALMTGLTPTLNQMSVIGLVSIPGMMTGTVLGGAPPLLAAKYQMVIMFVILFTSSFALCGSLVLATLHLFDREDNLSLHLILRRDGPKPPDLVVATGQAVVAFVGRRCGWCAPQSSAAVPELQQELMMPVAERIPSGRFHQTRSAAAPSDTVVLRLFDGAVTAEPSGAILVHHANLELHASDQLVFAGASGCGKTTICKALSTLQPLSKGHVEMAGDTPAVIGTRVWRSRVLYVRQQGGVGLPGTPYQLFEQLTSLKVQKARQTAEAAQGRLHDAIEKLEMQKGLLSQEWSSLSGGESQRVYLAIMIALRPDVLLLDEVTSGCDPASMELVEKLVLGLRTPGVWITHLAAQAERIATTRLEYRTDTAV